MIEFSEDMKMVADIIGDDATKQLIKKIGGVSIYIPKDTVDLDQFMTALRQNGGSIKRTAHRFNISERYAYQLKSKYVDDFIEKRQGNLFNY